MFENRYEIIRKLYADWARRPVLLSGRRRIPLLPVLVAVGCGVMLVRSVLDGRWGYGAMFALLLVLTVFRVLFYLPLMAARQHGRMLAQWGVDAWHRTVEFGAEKITVHDAAAQAEKTYDQVKEVRDQGEWLAVIFDGGTVVRLDKAGFFKDGKAAPCESFLAFFRAACPQAVFS